MIVGEAELQVKANTKGLKEEIASGSDPALSDLENRRGWPVKMPGPRCRVE